MNHVLSSRYYGFAGSEINWQDNGDAIVPSWYTNVPHRRFRFDEFDRPLLLQDRNFQGEPLRPGAWIFASNAISGVTARSGLGRVFTWFSVFKKWSFRDWVIVAEKYGIPSIVGKYRQDSTAEDKSALRDAVQDLGEAGYAIMSEATQIDIHEATRGGASTSLHSAIIKECNSEISKLITGSTLTLDSGGPGSFALGKVHETRAFDFVLADAELVMRRFRRDVALPFMSSNGFTGKPPELIIHVAREQDPMTRMQIFAEAQKMGLDIDRDQVREEMQFRAPPTPERTLQAPTAPIGGNSEQTDETE